jgi:RsiW-degrading membrane proteinase PrsW (M82 family)
MAQTPQTYKNHVRFFPLFHFFVAPVLLINFLNTIRHFYNRPARDTGWEMVVGLALVGLALAARLMALKVQDRVIRLEMRLRMNQLLPADLGARLNDLTPQQLIALRFASDAELAGLVREVLDGKLQTQKAIKERVQQWTGDYLRA